MDIIDIFLEDRNVEFIARKINARGTWYNARGQYIPVSLVRRMMTEYIYNYEGAGAFDVWSGTRAKVYVDNMNADFLIFARNKLCAHGPAPIGSRQREIDDASARADQAAIAYLRNGWRATRSAMVNWAPHDSPMRVASARGGACPCSTVEQDASHCAPRARTAETVGSLVRDSRRDIECDEVSREELARDSCCASLRFDQRAGPNDEPWLTDVDGSPFAMSGEAQWHLIDLDAQMARAPRGPMDAHLRFPSEVGPIEARLSRARHWCGQQVRATGKKIPSVHVRQTAQFGPATPMDRVFANDIFSCERGTMVRHSYIPSEANVESDYLQIRAADSTSASQWR